MTTMTSPEYAALCRAQRNAYFAWQNAPAGQSEEAIAAIWRPVPL